MNFIRRNIYFLLVLVVLVLGLVLGLRQKQFQATSHIEMREDFLYLCLQGNSERANHIYQELIQALPGLSDGRLVDDYERLQLFVMEHELEPASLAVKYQGAVRRVLENRVQRRLKQSAQVRGAHWLDFREGGARAGVFGGTSSDGISWFAGGRHA